MRFTLLDLFIAIGLMAIGMISTGPFANLIGLSNNWASLAVMIAVSTGIALIASSPLYRLFHLRPLLLPKCPVCGDRNRHYWCDLKQWPMETIVCATCHTRIQLCHDGTKCQWHDSSSHRFVLLWPHSFGGRWRRVSQSQLTEMAPSEGQDDG